MAAMKEKTTVLLADDHPLYREGLRRALGQTDRFEVVAEAGTGREALDAIKEHEPVVAVIDLTMPDLDGIAVVHAVARDGLPTRVLLLTAHDDSDLLYRAIQEGAAGYVIKDAPRDKIIQAIAQVARGQTVIPEELAGALAGEIRSRTDSDAPLLSDREREVLQLFSEGMSIPDVANQLFLAPSTVKSHTQRLYNKLGVSDRAAAVAEAMRRGLLE
ncbi:response regulator transcription factor [Kitasatospora sp. NPDC048540]|uniref:response regulator n=1 Tax=unclassified Kitasatospora TaxID=2633591 RepID=UPI00053AC2AC|nr:response regulator transcription factor [Kitasatospora sp. MBT63]